MTPAVPEDRRRRNVDVQAAHLEGRMDMIEQRLETMDEKIDGVASNIKEVLREIKATSDRMQRMDIEATERDGRVQLLEQRIGDFLIRPQTITTTTTTIPPAPSVKDELDEWRRRAVNVLTISFCCLLMLAIGVFIGRELLSREAASLAKEALGHAQ